MSIEGAKVEGIISLINTNVEAIKVIKEWKEQTEILKSILFFIFKEKKEKIINFICEEKSDWLKYTNSTGETPLLIAIKNGSSQCKLISKKSSLSIKTQNGNNIVHYICQSTIPKKDKFLKYVVSQNPLALEDINENGDTPLHCIARTQDYESTILLLKLGASKTKQNKNVMTPALIALEEGNFLMWDILKEGSKTIEDINEENKETEESLTSLMKTKLEGATYKGKMVMEQKVNELKASLAELRKKKTSLNEKLDEILKRERAKEMFDPRTCGIKGVLECIILARILEKHPQFLKNIDLVCGCSVGSILVSMLAIGITPRNCSDLLNIISQEVFVKPTIAINQPKYRNDKLKYILEYIFKEIKIKDIQCKYLVDTFRIDSEEQEPNRSCESFCFTNLQKGFEEEKLSDICLRSSSAPTYFQPYQNFVDGGMLNNTPIGLCWSFLFGEEGLQLNPKKVVCFSLSAGKPDPFYIDSNKIGKEELCNGQHKLVTLLCMPLEVGLLNRVEYQTELIPKLKEIAEEVDLTKVGQWLNKYWDN
ncbi:patatin, putative [Entamoeba histolytica]